LSFSRLKRKPIWKVLLNTSRATTALNVVHDLREKCLALANAPRGYPLMPRYEHHGIRRRPFGSYLIFYRVSSEAIEVVHIVYGCPRL
jgi:toxin ParE1/3/4